MKQYYLEWDTLWAVSLSAVNKPSVAEQEDVKMDNRK